MKYFAVLYRCRPGQAHRVMEEAGDHIRWVQAQIKANRFLCAGPFVNASGAFDDGLAIVKGKSKIDVEEAVRADPFVINGIRDYEIREWDYHVDEQGYRIEFPPELKARWKIA